MQKPGFSNKVLQKRIPTLVGISVLVLGLIAGTILFSRGTGVFAPRANPQTTPKNVRVTNVTDSTFTVSFLTDAQTSGFVKYGSSADDLENEAQDDRVQLSANNDLTFTLHHVTVRGLTAGQTYHYVIGSGGVEYDQEGVPFTVRTAQQGGVPPAARTINGVVLNENTSPAVNSVVYITLPGSGEMSALIRNQSGNWAIPLSDARTSDGSAYATITDSDPLSIFVQGPLPTQTAQFTTTVAESQPVATITFGQAAPSSVIGQGTRTTETKPSPSLSPSPSSSISQAASGSATRGTTLNGRDLTSTTSSGSSRTTTTTSNLGGDGADGDISPSGVDETGASGDDETRQIAQALVTPTPTIRPSPSPSPTPFGTNNPVPVGSSSASASPSASPRATASATPRATASASTSSLPVSGTVGTTLLLIIGGAFFMIAGTWSFWVGNALSKENS